MKHLITTAVVLVFVITVFVCVSCGYGGKHTEGLTSQIGTKDTDVGVSGSSPVSNTTTTRTLSIEQAIVQARAYDPPAEVTENAGFDPLVFERLRLEFIRQLESNKHRVTSNAPMGDAGLVTDLTYDPETRTLNWSYVNLGDYDSSGEVGIADITMIAQYYLANTTDGIGDDALETWIDGDKNGEVGVGDITPIIQGYLNEVSSYRILTADSENGKFLPVGEVVPFSDPGTFPKTFSASLPLDVLSYVALVVPTDALLEAGARSNGVKILPEWHFKSIHGTGVLKFSSIALDSNNHPHISYYDQGDFGLKYTYYDGSSWENETADGTCWRGGWTSIALDSNDRPHISYCDGENYDLKYAYFNVTSWVIETVDSVGDEGMYPGMYTSLALDTNNRPHISYYDRGNYDLKYAYYNGTSWVLETVDSLGDVGFYTSIALDSNNYPHISYYDDTNRDLKYAFYEGSYWVLETVDSMSNVGTWTSIALDSNDRPHISYNFGSASRDLKYAYYNGSSWVIETPDRTGDVGYDTSIALDSNGNPHISYYDYSYGDLKYACYNGSSWVIETADGLGDVGMYTSIALDSFDRPHISYFDYTSGDLKYAWFG